MTNKTRRPSIGIYFMVVILLLVAYYAFYGMEDASAVTYAQVKTFFQQERVESFYVRDGRELYLNLKQDGGPLAPVHNTLESVDAFREELGSLIEDQLARGVLADYNYDPPYTPPWWMEIALYLALIVAFFLFFQFMMGRAQGGGVDQGRRFGRARIRFGSESKQKRTFADVAGADEEKEELREIVGFLQEPQKYLDLGARIPKGVLLVGPPGTGKTLLAKAVAGEAGVQFLSISGSDFVELYVGVGASRVRDLFDEAKKVAPAVVFIDEIDAVGRQRGAGLGGGHDEREQTLNQLLVEMDGFTNNEGVVVLAATNRADILDPALLRPGRFDRQIYVGSPDSKGREEILGIHVRSKPLAEDVDLRILAQGTPGFTGADLENLVNEGALLAARRGHKFITMQDLQESVIKVIAGPEKRSKRVPEHERRLTAYHEAGHAVMHHCLASVDPVHQVTIVPRGQAGGMTISLPEEDQHMIDLENGRFMEQVEALTARKRWPDLRDMLVLLEPADIALVLGELSLERLPLLYRLLPKELAAEAFVEMEPEEQAVLIKSFSDTELKEVLEELYVDDTVDLIEEMPATVVKRILQHADPETRRSVNEILKYPEDSAGSIMTTEFVDLKQDMTVGDAFKRIRRTGVDKETINICYVTSPGRHLLGLVSIRTLLLSDEDDVIGEIMETNIISASTMDDKEDVAQDLSRYDFLAMPVVDRESRLVGIVTIDDAIDVMEEETTEDIALMAAITPTDKPYLRSGVWETVKSRLPWLMLLMLSATFTGIVISSFEDSLAACSVLIGFIPMLMGTGGNCGNQSSVAVIRSLSLNEIGFSDLIHVVWKESRVAVVCGALLAGGNFIKLLLVDRLLMQNEEVTILVAAVICLTLVCTVFCAKAVGCMLPLLAEKIGLDPAVMAAPFISTIVDVLSLLIYFQFAKLLLRI